MNFSNNPEHALMRNIYEDHFGSSISLMSHSHPNGGPPSYDLIGKNNTKVGDLNSAWKSDYNYQREAYDVPNNIKYGYNKYTYSRVDPSDRSRPPVYDYSKRGY